VADAVLFLLEDQLLVILLLEDMLAVAGDS
jgi:hypothetical protein